MVEIRLGEHFFRFSRHFLALMWQYQPHPELKKTREAQNKLCSPICSFRESFAYSGVGGPKIFYFPPNFALLRPRHFFPSPNGKKFWSFWALDRTGADSIPKEISSRVFRQHLIIGIIKILGESLPDFEVSFSAFLSLISRPFHHANIS